MLLKCNSFYSILLKGETEYKTIIYLKTNIEKREIICILEDFVNISNILVNIKIDDLQTIEKLDIDSKIQINYLLNILSFIDILYFDDSIKVNIKPLKILVDLDNSYFKNIINNVIRYEDYFNLNDILVPRKLEILNLLFSHNIEIDNITREHLDTLLFQIKFMHTIERLTIIFDNKSSEFIDFLNAPVELYDYIMDNNIISEEYTSTDFNNKIKTLIKLSKLDITLDIMEYFLSNKYYFILEINGDISEELNSLSLENIDTISSYFDYLKNNNMLKEFNTISELIDYYTYCSNIMDSNSFEITKEDFNFKSHVTKYGSYNPNKIYFINHEEELLKLEQEKIYKEEINKLRNKEKKDKMDKYRKLNGWDGLL